MGDEVYESVVPTIGKNDPNVAEIENANLLGENDAVLTAALEGNPHLKMIGFPLVGVAHKFPKLLQACC